MGLETIVFEAAGAGAMAALAPTSAIIRSGSGDAYIVGVATGGVTLERVTFTCPGDSRWEAAGFRKSVGGNGAAAGSAPYMVMWLPTKVPILRGATLIATQAGAGVGYALVYIEYPDIGEPFKPRDPMQSQPVAHQVFKLITAGAALVANTITVASAVDATFVRGRTYTPVSLSLVTGGTGPQIAVGIQSVRTQLCTYWLMPITEVLSGSQWHVDLPYGVETVAGGDTASFNFVSAAADTPAVEINYAYTP